MTRYELGITINFEIEQKVPFFTIFNNHVKNPKIEIQLFFYKMPILDKKKTFIIKALSKRDSTRQQGISGFRICEKVVNPAGKGCDFASFVLILQ